VPVARLTWIARHAQGIANHEFDRRAEVLLLGERAQRNGVARHRQQKWQLDRERIFRPSFVQERVLLDCRVTPIATATRFLSLTG
jgi:hypothetical protein